MLLNERTEPIVKIMNALGEAEIYIDLLSQACCARFDSLEINAQVNSIHDHVLNARHQLDGAKRHLGYAVHLLEEE